MAKVSVKIDGDSKGAENAIKKVKDQLGKLAENKTTKNFNTLGMAFGNIKTMAGATVETLKKVAAAVNECTEAYRVQANAEIRLEQAARNNPYLDSSSVTNLKNFASEIQNVTTYGDEELLPFMAQLAAAGRTEEQVMDIMKASVDLAASGTMSLDSAVKALNGTYQGNVGTLGKQIAGVKSLTKEQLANGEAVKLVAENYKGMAKETARATGSAKQLKNAWGDFKEHIGSGFEALIAPINRGITGIIANVNNAISNLKEAKKQAKQYKDVIEGNTEGLDSSATRIARNTALERKEYSKTSLVQAEQQLYTGFSAVGDTVSKREFDDLKNQLLAIAQEVAENESAWNKYALAGDYANYVHALAESIKANQEYNAADLAHNAKVAEEKAAEQKRLAEEWADEVTEAVNKARNKVATVDALRQTETEAGRGWTDAEYAQKLDDAYYQAYKELLEQSTDAAKMKDELSVKAFAEEVKNAAKNASRYKTASVSTSTTSDTEKERDLIAEAVKAYEDAKSELIGKQNLTGEYAAGSREANEFMYEKMYSIIEELVKSDPNLVKMGSTGVLYTDSADQRVKDLLNNFETFASSMRGYSDEEKKAEQEKMRLAMLEELEEVLGMAAQDESVPLSEQLKRQKAGLEVFAKEVTDLYEEGSEERLSIEETVTATMADLDKQITEAKRAESRERVQIAIEEAQAMTAAVQSYVDKSAQLINYLSDLNIKAADAEKASKMAALEEEYQNGIIAETDYVEKQKEIEKEAADQKYKAELWQWGSNLAQMAVSGAQAVLSALSTQPIYAGIAMAGLVGAMTAAQMGVAIANKPKAPSFAEGGIVPGSSWTGDNVQANVNSGEMILTRAQQADLWKRLNSGRSGWGSVAVNNYMGKDASIRTRRNERGLTIDVLDAHINRQMAMGGYDSGFAGHDMSSKGVRYL